MILLLLSACVFVFQGLPEIGRWDTGSDGEIVAEMADSPKDTVEVAQHREFVLPIDFITA